jgi:hypothetical protein
LQGVTERNKKINQLWRVYALQSFHPCAIGKPIFDGQIFSPRKLEEARETVLQSNTLMPRIFPEECFSSIPKLEDSASMEEEHVIRAYREWKAMPWPVIIVPVKPEPAQTKGSAEGT